MAPFLGALLRQRSIYGLLVLVIVFFVLRLTAPAPQRIDFEPAAESAGVSTVESPTLTDRLVPVHSLALCLDGLAGRITVDSDAAFELFDVAYRDECRSAVGVGEQWRLAADWFGPPFMPAVFGSLDSERELVVRAVRDDRAAGRRVRAAALWRTALLSMSARRREFVRLLALAYSPADPYRLSPPNRALFLLRLLLRAIARREARPDARWGEMSSPQDNFTRFSPHFRRKIAPL